MLDGVYRLTNGGLIFQTIPVPITKQRQALLTRIITQLLKALMRQGALMEEDAEIPSLANPDANPTLAPLRTATCTYGIVLGPRAGQKVLTWEDLALCLGSHEGPQSQSCVSA